MSGFANRANATTLTITGNGPALTAIVNSLNGLVATPTNVDINV
jgi:hypothetical protein